MLGFHGDDAGNLTSMSSGSGDGKAKSEVEESLLRRRLHGVEGFGLTGYRTNWRLHESWKAFCTREMNCSTMKERNVAFLQDSRYGT